MSRVSVALVHYPVLDRKGDIYTTSITNLDVHDIARSCRTYNVDAYYVVTPISAQQALANAIVGHWTQGKGAQKNKDRSAAMARTHVVESIEEALDREKQILSHTPQVWTTSAKSEMKKCLTFKEANLKIRTQEDVMLIFGTGQGLHPRVIDDADALLPPIKGSLDYNHLSVRSAAAIILDRLLAIETE